MLKKNLHAGLVGGVSECVVEDHVVKTLLFGEKVVFVSWIYIWEVNKRGNNTNIILLGAVVSQIFLVGKNVRVEFTPYNKLFSPCHFQYANVSFTSVVRIRQHSFIFHPHEHSLRCSYFPLWSTHLMSCNSEIDEAHLRVACVRYSSFDPPSSFTTPRRRR